MCEGKRPFRLDAVEIVEGAFIVLLTLWAIWCLAGCATTTPTWAWGHCDLPPVADGFELKACMSKDDGKSVCIFTSQENGGAGCTLILETWGCRGWEQRAYICGEPVDDGEPDSTATG